MSLNFKTGLDPRFKISGKLFCGALNLASWIQRRVVSSIMVLKFNTSILGFASLNPKTLNPKPLSSLKNPNP